MAQPHIIADRYKNEGLLGKGGMGAVYLARDLKLFERHVAVKLLREDLDDEQVRLRFVREAQSAATLRHKNIVTILDFGDHEGQPYLVIEFIEGETLGQLIKRRAPLPLSRRLQLIEELCSGLGHAHRAQVVHRDIKPANLMIASADQQLKILDFGIARLGESSLTQTGGLLGSVNYMSPEQVGGGSRVDHRSDIFSVGTVLYELLSYRQAFPGNPQSGVFGRICNQPPEPLERFCPGVDERIFRIVDKALAKDTADRYQDLDVMRREIVRAQEIARRERGDAYDTTKPAGATTVLLGSGADAPAQVDATIDGARRAFEQGDFGAAIDACERLLEAEPTRMTAAALLERARTAQVSRQIEEWLTDAQREMDRGSLSVASALIDRAEVLSPTSPQVRAIRASLDKARAMRLVSEARQQFADGDHAAALERLSAYRPPNTVVDAAYEELKSEADRHREVTDLVSRASQCLKRTEFEAGLALVAQALARAPEDPSALALKQQLDAAWTRYAEKLVQKARKRYDSGNTEAAVQLLAGATRSHPLIDAALGELRSATLDRTVLLRKASARGQAVVPEPGVKPRTPGFPVWQLGAASVVIVAAGLVWVVVSRPDLPFLPDAADDAPSAIASTAAVSEPGQAETGPVTVVPPEAPDVASAAAADPSPQTAVTPPPAPVEPADVPAGPPLVEESQEIAALLTEGNDAIAAGRYPDAVTAYEEVLTLEPDNGQASSMLARVNALVEQQSRIDQEVRRFIAEAEGLTRDRTYDTAIQQYAAALRLDPSNAQAIAGQEETRAMSARADAALSSVAGGEANVAALTAPGPGGCARGAPLTVTELDVLLSGGVPGGPIRQLVVTCGATFILDAAAVSRVRSLGATDELLRVLASPTSPAAGAAWTSPIDRQDMVWVPPGQFQMGSPDGEPGRDDDELQHAVTLDRGFWLDVSEVSNAAYRRFIVANTAWRKTRINARFQDGNYLQDWTGTDYPAGTENDPVVFVSWYAARAYAAWAGKRLPSEAEWEYAGRAGTSSQYWWGDEFDTRRVRSARSVGTLDPLRRSAWGAYDLVGGVWEWTASLFQAYPSRRGDGRDDPDANGARVVRGGYWGGGEPFLRVANRSSENATLTNDTLGFRTVR